MLSDTQSFNKNQENSSNSNNTQHLRSPNIRHDYIPRSEALVETQNNQIEGVFGSQDFLEIPDQSQNKSLTKKQKYLIALGVLIALAMIIGGVVAYKVLSDQEGDPEPTIPSTYKQYEKEIKTNQQSNVIELINVPKSQRIYTYTLINNQTTAQDENNKTFTQSTIIHTFGLLCLDVNEFQFDMILYFIDTTMKGNSVQDASNLTGYPKIKEVNKQKRNLQQNQEKDGKNSFEIGILTPKEIEILAQANITPEQFYSSNLPIIRFNLRKDGFISQVKVPINLRQDLQQIFLNILEQLSPIVLKDYYNTTKNRILTEATQKHNYRMLSGELVNPDYNANIQDKSTAYLNKNYTTVSEKSSNSQIVSQYDQNSKMKNGALSQSKVTSDFSMEDSGDKSDNTKALFSNLRIQSECKIKYISQQDIVDESFLQQISKDHDSISVYQFTWKEAVDAFNKLYNKSSQDLINEDGNQNSGRVLQQTNKTNNQTKSNFGQSITKPVFRKTYSSMEFGADIQSSCVDQPKGGDICTVGLYSYFNGASLKLIEKQTTVNISKVLKIYQYIVNNVNDRFFVAHDKIKSSIEAISIALDDIISKVEQTIDIEKNPILSQIKLIVEQDKLNIVGQIKQIEQLIQLSLNSVNQILEEPLKLLKGKVVNYSAQKYPQVEKKIADIKNFYTDKYTKISAFIKKAKQNGGMSSALKDQVKQLLNHHIQVISQLIEIPVKKANEDIQLTLQNLQENILTNATLVQQLINKNISSTIDALTKSNNLTSLNLNFSNIPGLNLNATQALTKFVSQISNGEQIKLVFNDSIKSIINNTQTIIQVKNDTNSALEQIKSSVFSQLDQLTTTGDAISSENQKAINDFKTELNTIVSSATDLYSDLIQTKQNINDSAEKIKIIQDSDFKQTVQKITNAVLNLPVKLALKVKDDSVATALELKTIGSKIFKDVLSWKDDLVNDSKVLLEQAKNIYSAVKEFLTKKESPEDDPKCLQKPLFDDIQSTFDGVKSVMSTKYNIISEKYQRLKQIPDKFQKFITDLKSLYQSSFQFINNIKLAITSPNIDTGIIGDFITKALSGPKQQQQQGALDTVEKEINKPISQNISQVLLLQLEQLVNKDLLNFNSSINSNQSDSQSILKSVLKELISKADFSNNFNYPLYSLPIEYNYQYPTPIGLVIQLKLKASWDTSFNLGFVFKNAILDFSASVNTKVSVLGEVSASIIIAEAGGYAKGTFLDTTLTVGVNLQIMNNYSGKYYVDGTFKPYDVQVGIYYQYKTIQEGDKCASDITFTPEELAKQSDEVKKAVQAAQNQSFWGKITSAVKSAVNCITSTKIITTRVDLFEPITIKGESYSKRLADGTF